MTMSTAQSAGRRRNMSRSASNCLCVGMNLRWFALIWASMVVLGCDSMDYVLHGESSQAGRIKTTSSELGDVVEEALHISSRSYSGLVMQDPVSR